MRLSKQFALLCCSIMAILICASNKAASQSFEAIELSEAAPVPMSGPIKWSPDGSSIAFIYKNSLSVCDLEGTRRDLAETDGRPHRFEWIDGNRLAIQVIKQLGRAHNQYILLEVNADSSSSKIVDSFEDRPSDVEPGKTAFSGPFRSIAGRTYYLRLEYTGNMINIPRGRVHETIKTVVWLDDQVERSIESQYSGFREWGGVSYLLNIAGTDSIPIPDKSPLESYRPSNVSKDLKYVIRDGVVKSVDGSENISLRSKLGIQIENQVSCGFLYDTFSPNDDLVLFDYACVARDSSGNEKAVDHVVLYDISQDRMHIIDTLVGISNCTMPAFSPSGDKIAFIGQKKLMVLDIGGLG